MLDDTMRPGRAVRFSRRDAVRRDLSWQRFAFAGAIALVVSTQVLFQPDLLEFWSAADIALAVGRYALELLWIASVQVVVFTVVDHLADSAGAMRPLAFALSEAGASFVSVLAVFVVESLPSSVGWQLGRAFAESLRWTLLAGFASSVFLAHGHAVTTRRLAVRLEEAREALQREQLGMQLQLLQAQIEPHFLFNTLANMRRLYRIRPDAGAQMLDSLLRYLRAALPRIRNDAATLGDELALISAYLDLVRIRMGAPLRYRIDAAPALHALPFPPMLLFTLVENAVKHGFEQAARSGTIEVSAHPVGPRLELTVSDDGVGLGGSGAGGHGVGLANVSRQLALRFGNEGRLSIAQRLPCGVVCTLRLPLQRTAGAGTCSTGGSADVSVVAKAVR